MARAGGSMPQRPWQSPWRAPRRLGRLDARGRDLRRPAAGAV